MQTTYNAGVALTDAFCRDRLNDEYRDLARAMTAATDTPQRTAQPFVQTSARSWAESSYAQLENPEQLTADMDKGDVAGPVSIGLAVAVPVARTGGLRPWSSV